MVVVFVSDVCSFSKQNVCEFQLEFNFLLSVLFPDFILFFSRMLPYQIVRNFEASLGQMMQ